MPNFIYHLGMQVAAERSSCRQFQYLVDRVSQRLNGWKEKSLSYVGREVLIKSIIQVIPSYTMQCFFNSEGYLF